MVLRAGTYVIGMPLPIALVARCFRHVNFVRQRRVPEHAQIDGRDAMIFRAQTLRYLRRRVQFDTMALSVIKRKAVAIEAFRCARSPGMWRNPGRRSTGKRLSGKETSRNFSMASVQYSDGSPGGRVFQRR